MAIRLPWRRKSTISWNVQSTLTFSQLVNYAAKKAANTTNNLAEIMLQVGSAGRRQETAANNCCKIHYPVCRTPMERNGFRWERNRRTLSNAQRQLAIRICCGYRTISTEAAFVLVRVIPWQEKRTTETDSKATARGSRHFASDSKGRCHGSSGGSTTTADHWTKKHTKGIRSWLESTGNLFVDWRRYSAGTVVSNSTNGRLKRQTLQSVCRMILLGTIKLHTP